MMERGRDLLPFYKGGWANSSVAISPPQSRPPRYRSAVRALLPLSWSDREQVSWTYDRAGESSERAASD
jgi:hypothetical protein